MDVDRIKTRSGLSNTPSPRGSGEWVGVRGKDTVDLYWEQ
jgi:hypothetical protein